MNFFNGECFSCQNFRHKATQCVAYKTIMTREARNQMNVIGVKKSSYNNFSLLENEIETTKTYFIRYTQLPCVEPACIHTFTKRNQRTDLQIQIYELYATLIC